MIVFWIAAGLMVAGACMFLLPPLLRARSSGIGADALELNLDVHREQLRDLDAEFAAGNLDPAQHAAAVRELQDRVLQDASGASRTEPGRVGRGGRWSAAAIGAFVAAAGVGSYAYLGAPGALDSAASKAASAQGDHALDAQRIVALVEGLSVRLKANPDDGEGWAMLARSYGVLGRHQDALLAYQNAVQRIDNNAALLTDYADTLALMRGRKLAGEPYELIKRALAIDPRNLKALALAGTAEFDGGNAAGALAHWEKILMLVPADAPFARSIAGSIAQARQQLGSSPGAPAAAAVMGTARLAPAIAGRVEPSDTVFVFARAADGPRMPLAIQKRTAREFPFEFRLDDSMAMAGGTKLSQAESIVVGVRVSKRGSATPVSGDIEGSLGPIKAGGAPLAIVVDRVVP